MNMNIYTEEKDELLYELILKLPTEDIMKKIKDMEMTKDALLFLLQNLITKLKQKNEESYEYHEYKYSDYENENMWDRNLEKMYHNQKIFVRNLSFNTREERLIEFFSQYGEVKFAYIKYDKPKYSHQTYRSKGFGFVIFSNQESAEKALQETEKIFDGRTIQCFLASKYVDINSRPPNRRNKV